MSTELNETNVPLLSQSGLRTEFPSETPWSVVLEATQSNDERKQAALARLYALYAPPVLIYLIRRIGDRQRAEDLTQDLFLKLIERDSLRGLGPRKGERFRSYLRMAAENLLRDEERRTRTERRGGNLVIEPLPEWFDDACIADAAANAAPPDHLYDQQWGRNLVEITLAALRHQFAAQGEAQLFIALSPLLTESGDSSLFEEIAAKTGKTPGAVKTAGSRLRKQFATEFRKVVAGTLGAPMELEDELRYLEQVLSQ